MNPDLLLPRLGVDESGKGDFFGPLCIAGAYVNEAVVKAWADVGIRDSKNISSDKRIKELAELIRKTPGCVTTVVPIGNEAYNRLYAKMRSVNAMLAWGHARVIENLMGQRHRMNPPPVRAISDQFAANKETVAKALMTSGPRDRAGPEAPGRGRPGRGRRLDPGPARIRHPPGRVGKAVRHEDSPKAPRRRWMPRPRNSSPNTAPKASPKSPRCTSAPPCARKACRNRRKSNGDAGPAPRRAEQLREYLGSAGEHYPTSAYPPRKIRAYFLPLLINSGLCAWLD